MKIIAFTDNAQPLIKLINEKIDSKKNGTWKYKKDEEAIIYSHTNQWKNIVKPCFYNDRVEFEIVCREKNEEHLESKGYITGRFVELLMVHFRNQFTNLEIK